MNIHYFINKISHFHLHNLPHDFILHPSHDTDLENTLKTKEKLMCLFYQNKLKERMKHIVENLPKSHSTERTGFIECKHRQI